MQSARCKLLEYVEKLKALVCFCFLRKSYTNTPSLHLSFFPNTSMRFPQSVSPALRDASHRSLSFLSQSPPREGSQGELTPANSQTRMSTNMWRLDQMPLLGKYTGPLSHLRPPFRNQLFPCWREKNHNLKTLFKLGRRSLLSVLKTSTPCCSNEKEKKICGT